VTRLLPAFLLALSAGMLPAGEMIGPFFREGMKKGLMSTPEGFLSLYYFRDTFGSDSRDSYSLRTIRSFSLDEWKCVPPDCAGGIAHSSARKALVMESRKETVVSVAKDTPPLEDFYFRLVFSPLAVFPPNGITVIEMYAGKEHVLRIRLPGSQRAHPALLVYERGKKCGEHPCREVHGYSGVPPFTAAVRPTADRYEPPGPPETAVEFIRENDVYTLRIDGKRCVRFSHTSTRDVTRISVVSRSQVLALREFFIVSLKGRFVSEPRRTLPGMKKVTVDAIRTAPLLPGARLDLAVEEVSSDSPAAVLKRISCPRLPADITDLYIHAPSLRYVAAFSVPSSRFLLRGGGRVPPPPERLPALKTILVTERK